MNISYAAHSAFRTLSLVGLLLVPFSLGQAAELVGKPVAISASSAGSAASLSPVAPTAPDASVLPDVDSARSEVHQAMEDVRRDFHQDFGAGFDHFGSSPELIIPIVAMSLLFGGPVLLLIILSFLHYRAKARRQQNINANIDKLLAAGKDIPLELLLGEEPAAVKRTATGDVRVYRSADENMRKGVRNIGLGTGWLIFLTIMFGIKIGAFGFIFIGLGISQVVIWKLSEAPAQNQLVDVNRAQD